MYSGVGLSTPNPEQNFAQGGNGKRLPQTRDYIAKDLGISGEQYRKIKYVYENAPEDIKERWKGKSCDHIAKEKYEVVSGHRRVEASREANLVDIPANVKELSDEDAFHISFVDNQERENLNPIDEARHYRKAQEEFGYSTRKMAELYGRAKDFYRRKLLLLSLPTTIKNQLAQRCANFTENHCVQICKIFHIDQLEKKFVELYGSARCKWTLEQVERFDSEVKKRQDRVKMSVRTSEHPSTMLLNESRGLDDGIPALQVWYTFLICQWYTLLSSWWYT